MISFTVPGAPQGKARARTVTQGGRTHSFTPAKTAQYEALVRQTYIFTHPGQKPLSGPILMEIKAYMPIPESWTKGKKARAIAGLIQPTTKPDADNIAKCIADALNGVAWEDDKQIIYLRVTKTYGLPRVEVEICPA